jgi:hypothetical protein
MYDIRPFVMLRYEASSSPCIAAISVEEDPSYLRMTNFFYYVMGSYGAMRSFIDRNFYNNLSAIAYTYSIL